MESKLDDKYYQKYIQYKNKYLMLKQFKNNNDLEGGMFGNLFGSKEIKEAKPISQKLQKIITETDGDYLVFNIEDINQDSYKYVVDQNLETNKINKIAFNQKNYDKAYIITKKGNDIICKIITDEKNKNIQASLATIKKNLYLDDINQKHPKLNNCIENYNQYSDDIIRIFSKQQITNPVINAEFTKMYNNFIDTSNKMKTTLSLDNTQLNNSFNNILLLPEYTKYETFNFDFKFPFTITYSTKFLKDLTDNIQTKTGATVKLNMIIKITENADEYIFEKMGDSSISNTPMYDKIADHKIKSKRPAAVAAATATESAPATETPAESSEAK
jgi:hypothetical protein